MTPIIQYTIKGIIGILLFTAMYFVVRGIRQFDPMKKVQEQVDDWERRRLFRNLNAGTSWLERLLDHLDRNLTQAGIKRFLPKHI